MVRSLLLAFAATLLALLWTAPAAAFVGQCHVANASGADRPSSSAQEGDDWSCRSESVRIRPDQVPICLVEGASAVAPLPRIPVGDARAERADPPVDPDQWVPGSHESPTKPQVMLGDALLPAPPPLVPPAPVTTLPRIGPSVSKPRDDTFLVYRPPRR
ncbi:MAG TPA: hypothetical protein VFB62_04585 [Polyangiaceae bacterium]|jgi:hypothetical protein|nr:hypothetical protein [Polyangiaceae bacterium]